MTEVPSDGFSGHQEMGAHVQRTHPEWSAAQVERLVAHDALTRNDGRVAWRHDGDASTWSPDPEALWAVLVALPMPIDLIRASDGLVDDAGAAEFLTRRPDARVLVLEAGHRVAAEAPIALANAVKTLTA